MHLHLEPLVSFFIKCSKCIFTINNHNCTEREPRQQAVATNTTITVDQSPVSTTRMQRQQCHHFIQAGSQGSHRGVKEMVGEA